MIGRSKGEDINDAIKGPVGYLGLGIIVIGAVMALANDWSSGVDAPDEPMLFGGFLADMIYEIKYYMYAIVPIVMVIGGLAVALQLKIVVSHLKTHPNKKPKSS